MPLERSHVPVDIVVSRRLALLAVQLIRRKHCTYKIQSDKPLTFEHISTIQGRKLFQREANRLILETSLNFKEDM